MRSGLITGMASPAFGLIGGARPHRRSSPGRPGLAPVGRA
jgi:hypothetical protein